MAKSHSTAEPVIDVVTTPVDPKATAATPPTAATLTREARQIAADKIVMKGTYACAGVGFIPFPIIDILAVSGFQMKMIAELSELHNVKFSEHVARNVITALLGSLAPVIVGRMVGRTLLKFIPGVGTAIASLWIQGAIDGATTYAIGRVFQRHFEQGGTIFDFNISSAKEYFIIKFHEGKTIIAKSVGNATTAAASTFRSKEKPVEATVTQAVPV